VVVGGGPAGVAAATVLGEAGKSVVLVEKYGFCGGAAVAGLSGTICGLYLTDSKRGEPQQIVHGFAERFRKALDSRGGLTAPQNYGNTWSPAHDPHVWRECADDFIENANVTTLLHTRFVAP